MVLEIPRNMKLSFLFTKRSKKSSVSYSLVDLKNNYAYSTYTIVGGKHEFFYKAWSIPNVG